MRLNLTKDGKTTVVEDVCSFFDPHNFPQCIFWLVVGYGLDLVQVYGLDFDPYKEIKDDSFEDCASLREIHDKLKNWPYTEQFYSIVPRILNHLDATNWKLASPTDVTEKDSDEFEDELDIDDD